MFAGVDRDVLRDAIHFSPKGNAMLRGLIVERIRPRSCRK
jgi:hypothetical protein